MISASSLAVGALQVLIFWKRQSVQAGSDALEQRPALGHVYTLFCDYGENAKAAVQSVHATVKLANDAALAAVGIGPMDLPLPNIFRVNGDGCFMRGPSWGEEAYEVTKQRLRGSIPSAAALGDATARVLHVAAGAPRAAAAALDAYASLRAARVGSTVYAVVRHFFGYGDDGAQLRSVWRSRAEARAEARRLTGEEEWRRIRRAVRTGGHPPGRGLLARGDLTDGSDDGGGDDDNDLLYGDGFDFCDVQRARLAS